MRLFWTLGRRYPWQTLFTLAGILFAGISEGFGLSALLPLLNRIFQAASPASEPGEVGLLIDRLVGRFLATLGLEATVPVLLGLFVLCILLKCALVFLANKQIGYTVTRIATEMRLALLQSLFQTRWEYFIRQPVGELTNGVATEAHRASLAFHFGARMASMAVEALIYLGLAVLVSWQATVLAMFGGGVILVVLRGLIKKNRKAGRQQTVHTQALIAEMTDILISIKPLKAMAREEAASILLHDRTRKVNRALQKQVLSKAYLSSLQEPILTLFLVLCLYSALVFWHLSLTVIVAMVFCVGKSLKQFQKIQHEYINLVEFESAYWSLEEKIEQARSAPEARGGLPAPDLRRAIRFESVSFRYNSRPVLQEVSLEIAAGSLAVLYGPSGAGKSTIADLLIGLIRPEAGEIRIDDLPLSRIDLRDWRSRIGYVPQENLLLSDTVFQNVTLGNRGLSPEAVQRALEAAGAWPFVAGLPQGMFSVVGERGSMLSGGQRQRIAIARALVRRPRLLILDEATTALDPATEREICASLRRLKGELTILAISHQAALLEEADRAFRVEGGRVIQDPPAPRPRPGGGDPRPTERERHPSP
ncbi:MAG: ABC transporter ATP-binding protein [Desulfobacterales bacterium]